MSEIFISHAVADRHLAELLVDFLTDAIGVPEKSIFCSSLPGHGNPLSHNFNTNMREQIQHPKLVILLMTPSYLDSRFCVMELGGTWALALKPLPIVVPPVTFTDVTNTLGQIQGWDITAKSDLETVRQLILETLGIEGRGNYNFERKRSWWETGLTSALSKLALSPRVARADFDAVAAERDDLKCRLQQSISEANDVRHKLDTLKSLRPVAMVVEPDLLIAEDIAAIMQQHGFVVGAVVRTAKEAIEKAIAIKPDIITTEIPLADGSSGIDAVNEILKTHDSGIVFVTAYPEMLLKVKHTQPAYLESKPFFSDQLAATIRLAYADALSLREDKARSEGRNIS
ncbi:TIR domain-containing protein [Rhizobium rhizosphaerae]|uniref:TIR domain-containing protein n=1 Tax=Xaviernesmea rhizosphaerae TaxID=1672749 RepID=UPI00094F9943|nr:TIR domain-containing protein [Xaviernesmea rhizosphaerae]